MTALDRTAPPPGDATARHAAVVRTLQASYAAIPAGQSVRLAKTTSNLFRPRAPQRTAGLDVSGLDAVISLDPGAKTADVQGVCTYEHLVETTLQHDLMPLVVPQLKTITLGGAVTGLGVESSSFRNGLPHESVIEMDILTGDGRLVTARPEGEHAELFHAFPNSYGSLGYAVRLRIALERVAPYVALRHVAFADPDAMCAAVSSITAHRSWQDEPVDFLDGVMFAPDETYLTLGRWCHQIADSKLLSPSDYGGQQVFYRSLRERSRDVLTTNDYLWRWDTDWFWCSAAVGAQHPLLRRVWPRRWRRSDVYHRVIALENRWHVKARLDRLRGAAEHERVVQDVEIPLEQTAAFLRWFAADVAMRPVWLCPLKLYEPTPGSARRWPLYPLSEGQVYVNIGFWGQVAIAPGHRDGDVNRLIEDAVEAHGGHKSLYSDAYYEEDRFAAIYGGPTYARVKSQYDPHHRLTGLYEKAVGCR